MRSPLLYEINTRCWLRELSAAAQHPVTLASVPDSELATWRRLGFTHIWLMGVWTTGPRARAEALRSREQRQHYSAALPDWVEEDVGGSPYAIAEYRVPTALGGEEGLKNFRSRLQAHGLKLVLDFVPNHLGLDHRWVCEQPELFVQGPGPLPETFAQPTAAGLLWLAHGKDPYFAGWTDTVQLDYRQPATHAAMTELLLSVAARCDGVRCDMAMLALADVFAKTWERFPAKRGSAVAGQLPVPLPEFWDAAITATRRAYPGFLFLAEAYWGLEPRLQALGFDYTYDKELYDRLVSHDGPAVQHHLVNRPSAADAHFLENHDEPRIASLLSLAEHRTAALMTLSLPGLRFLHEGQLSGARTRTPVQLIRRAREQRQPDIESMYDQLLSALAGTAVGDGDGVVLGPRSAWPDNPTAQNFALVQWQARPPVFELAVMNFAPHASQCRAPLAIPELTAHDWSMNDLLGSEQYVRSGEELQTRGLYLDVPPHAVQLFRFKPV